MTNESTTLFLPKRYENLREAAEEQDADLTRIVRKVPEATERLEVLVRQVKNSRMGRFEFVMGMSGSGKTTFLSTLPRFFSTAHVTPLPGDLELSEIPGEIKSRRELTIENQIFVILDRDNPVVESDAAYSFFEEIRRLFRTPQGRVLILWPITDQDAARQLASKAWEVGRDSIVDDETEGVYSFSGLSRDLYYEVADVTTRSLNSGQSLEAFGLGSKVAAPFIQQSKTISEFFGKLERKSQEINNEFGDTLRERRIPSVWILVGGDDTRELNITVATLTQGTEKRVDIDRILAILDDEGSTTRYLDDWRTRRDEVAYLMRRLDVRLFELPPNVSLASIRAFGDGSVKHRLRKSYESANNASQAVRNSRFFQALAGLPTSSAATLRPAVRETANEYRRVQQVAARNDKPLNKALAQAVQRACHDSGIAAEVTAERRSLDGESSLRPDLLVEFPDGRVVCLEPTWRTTGTEIPDELNEQQSSMTVGHIQQYLLSKVLEYVKDLGF